MTTIEKYQYIMDSYAGKTPVAFERGGGVTAVADDGKEYIDFGAGVGVNSLGYCDETWAEAVCGQVRALQHTSNLYYNKANADFAEKLSAVTGYPKMFFANSGAEANECAIKLARKYSFDKYGKGRHNIITLVNSFHGRTMATLTATGQDKFHNYFFPFLEGFLYAEADNIRDLTQKLDDSVCAVMIEYIQGEGGVCPLSREFVDEIYRLCGEKDILVIADEVQTGAGRTGKFLCGEHYEHKADITTMAKGIFGGLPGGVCLANEKCAGVLTPGTHGSTFGGNPVVLSGGIAVINKIADPDFLTEVSKKGDYIRNKLSGIGEVVSISGKGLMLGLTLKTKTAAEVVKTAAEKGLLLLTAGTKLRMLPPLNIGYAEIDKGLEILAHILEEE